MACDTISDQDSSRQPVITTNVTLSEDASSQTVNLSNINLLKG